MNFKTNLTLALAICLFTLINPKITRAQSSLQTPVLKSINLPFNIDGKVVRDTSAYGDWTKGTYTNGNDSGAILYDNGDPRPFPLTFHRVDPANTPGSGTDDVFDGGNKTNADPTTWGWKLGSAPNKNDMNNCNIHFSEDANDDFWAVMSGDRYTVNGTSYIDFEFYQSPISSFAPSGGANGYFTTSGTNCGRTAGDLLVTVEYTNGGRVDSIYFYRWDSTGGTSCGWDWVSFTISNDSAFGFSNDSTIAVPYGAFGMFTYTQIQFVEIAINITGVVERIGEIVNDPCEALVYRSLFVKTKASASPTADLKDMIAPFSLDLNLGQAEISYDGPFCAGSGTQSVTKTGPASTDGGTYSISPSSSRGVHKFYNWCYQCWFNCFWYLHNIL